MKHYQFTREDGAILLVTLIGFVYSWIFHGFSSGLCVAGCWLLGQALLKIKNIRKYYSLRILIFIIIFMGTLFAINGGKEAMEMFPVLFAVFLFAAVLELYQTKKKGKEKD